MLRTIALLTAATLTLGTLPTRAAEGTGREKGVKLTEQEGLVRVEIDGKHFGDYRFDEKDANFKRPYMYPVNAADGQCVTSDQVRLKTKEHPHHRSFWVSHENVNGVNHWTITPDAGLQKHVKFLEPLTGDTIKEEIEWLGKDKQHVQLREIRTVRFSSYPDGTRAIDLTVHLTAENEDVTLGDAKDAGLCSVRVHPQMSGDPKAKPSPGMITNAAGQHTEKEAWGKPANWCDYTGKIDGKTYGITTFDHPSNPRHPTTWHVRDYGLMSANCWGYSYFDKKNPKGAGDMKIDKGKSVTFQYRVLIHTGDVKAANVDEKYKEWAMSSVPH